ncbi:hypothetical protein ACCO45_009437 [Purpureocillium lilacinum]|uniref:Uncharacterized protein n=1 Tax=Purpureocillium lilacinum TaxID=33203 RepID=A0ACC4DMD1_PURLI
MVHLEEPASQVLKVAAELLRTLLAKWEARPEAPTRDFLVQQHAPNQHTSCRPRAHLLRVALRTVLHATLASFAIAVLPFLSRQSQSHFPRLRLGTGRKTQRLLLPHQLEPERPVYLPRRRQEAVCVEDQVLVPDFPGKVDAVLHQSPAQTHPPRTVLDQQCSDPRRLGHVLVVHEEDAAEKHAVSLCNPAALDLWVILVDKICHDACDHGLEALVPAIVVEVDDGVPADDVPDVSRAVLSQHEDVRLGQHGGQFCALVVELTGCWTPTTFVNLPAEHESSATALKMEFIATFSFVEAMSRMSAKGVLSGRFVKTGPVPAALSIQGRDLDERHHATRVQQICWTTLQHPHYAAFRRHLAPSPCSSTVGITDTPTIMAMGTAVLLANPSALIIWGNLNAVSITSAYARAV